MDLSTFKNPKNLLLLKKKPRFDNNFCFYCGKPGHQIMDYRITIHQINFVISIFIATLLTTIPFAIKIHFETQ